jgi:hypothetical protein
VPEPQPASASTRANVMLRVMVMLPCGSACRPRGW